MAQKAVLDAGNLLDWIKSISSKSSVMAPVKQGRTSFAFTSIDDPSEVRLDYVRTVLSPKQAFLPSREPLLALRRESLNAAPLPASDPFVLFGVHPCDLTAINQLDWSMLQRHNVEDPYYLARRKAATIVAVDCLPDKYCFCTSVRSDQTRTGADVFLTPVKSGYVVESLTEKGAALLKSAKLREGDHEVAEAEAFPQQKRRRTILKLGADVDDLPVLLDIKHDSEIWQQTALRCYSCGTCTNVCPTCFCFDVRELADLTLETASRWRQYDSCQFNDFALVAGGHNFRGERSDRVRHRWFRKFVYLKREHGQTFCVGCGRCSQQCTAGISLVDVINSIVAEAKERAA
jgi:ferredoxin